jgi:hypothetical protein
MSKDDSDIAAMMESSPNTSMLRNGGLKGRFRRALSLNAPQALNEERVNEEEDDDPSEHILVFIILVSHPLASIRSVNCVHGIVFEHVLPPQTQSQACTPIAIIAGYIHSC